MNLKQNYDLTITLLSPLHIGSGRELLRDYDYVTHGSKTWVIRPEGMLDAFVDAEGVLDERILGRPARELLRKEDFDPGNRTLFRYVLPGQPRAQGYGAVLREQYKDAFDRPYIPGSSIKGSLRTMLAWHGFQAQKLALNVGDLQGGRSWAAQPIERRIFGRDPNHDLLRAVQVGDSTPQEQETLRIVNAQVVTGSEKFGSPIEVEAVWTDTLFHATLTLDGFLRSDQAEAELRMRNRFTWLNDLPAIGRAWAQQHLERERDWFRQRKYDAVGRLYHQMLGLLKTNKLSPNQFFMQIGWGGGWESKTLGNLLRTDRKQWEGLLGDKRLSPARFKRKVGDAFPKSRRVVVVNNQVAAPMGWCLVEMKER